MMKHDRRGFTLVELIVVIGLMGLLSTISIGGYFAASRGMAARGVVQDTASLIRQAMQTCLIDQTPTAVLFLNRRLNTESEGGEAYGTAIAIKMTGRISYVARNGGKTSQGNSISVGGGALLIDEFADWNQSYSIDGSDNAKQRSVRLYRMFSGEDGFASLEKGYDKCYSLMCAWAGYKDLSTDYMMSSNIKIGDWCTANKKDVNGNKNFSGIGYENANSFRWGLPFHPQNEALRVNDWRIGDGYGIEIGSLDLPKNYIFGSSVPSGVKYVAANSPSKGVLVFTPGQITSATEYKFGSVGSVDIYVLNDIEGKDRKQIGKVDSSMLEDQK